MEDHGHKYTGIENFHVFRSVGDLDPRDDEFDHVRANEEHHHADEDDVPRVHVQFNGRLCVCWRVYFPHSTQVNSA